MKFVQIFCSFLFIALVRALEGTVAIDDKVVHFGEIDTQQIRQLEFSSSKAKIDIKFKLDQLKRAPHQLMFTIGDLEQGLEQYFVPKFDESTKVASVSIPVKKISPKLLSRSKTNLRLLIGDQDKSMNLSKQLVELVPSSELKNSVKYAPQEKLEAKPEIFHQFRAETPTVSPSIPVIFIGVAVFMFILLLISWTSLVGSDLFGAFASLNSMNPIANFGFLASIAGVEVVFFLYYLHLSIFSTIYYVFNLSILGLYFGSKVFKNFDKLLNISRA